MTISSTTRKAGPFVGNGVTTEFPFDFKLFATSDLRVVRADALGVETDLAHVTDCTVRLNADQDENPGGSVVLNAPLADGFRLVLLSAVPELQPVDLTNQGGFYPELVNGGLDRATVQVQQLREQMGRSITVPVTSEPGDLALPSPAPGQLLGWTGVGLTNFDPSELVSVVAYGATHVDKFTGDGTTTAFTLSASPGVQNNLRVSIGGVVQVPGEDFTWGGGSILTFAVAPPAATRIVVQYQEALLDFGGANADLSNVVPSVGRGALDVPSVEGAGVDATAFRESLSLGNVDNTSDADKPVSTAASARLQVLDRAKVPVVSLDAFGADPTGATNSDAAFLAALNALGLIGGVVTGTACIQFGAGLYKFSAPLDIVMSASTRNSLAIRGLGMNITKLQWTNTDGIRVTTNGERNSFHMSDLSLLTDTAGGGRTALKITNVAEFGGGAGNAFNIDRIYIAGSDKVTLRDSNTKYWSYGVITTAVSNINFNAVSIAGAGLSGLGNGILYQGDGATATFAVVCTVTNCLFYALDQGFIYGTYVQGVFITHTNFTNGNRGIYQPPGTFGTDQLNVVNCQFNTALDQILIDGISHALFQANLFFILYENTSAISIQNGMQIAVIGNNFNGPEVVQAGTNGVYVNTNYASNAGIIQGNTFYHMSKGILLGGTTSGWNVQGNAYSGNTANVQNDAGAGNSVGVATQ